MSKIGNIIKSRFIKGENLPDWYEQRLSKCSTCPLNSANIENKSFKVSSWEIVAGKHCTHKDCGCTITEKAKIEEEQCPDNPPKWFAVKSLDENHLTIVANSENITVDFRKAFGYFAADIGDIEFNTKKTFSIKILSDEEMERVTVSPGCGCTATQVKWVGDGYIIDIIYSATVKGKFDKPVKITYRKNNKQQVTMVRIIGETK